MWWGNRPAEEKESERKKNEESKWGVLSFYMYFFSRAEGEVFKPEAEKIKGKIRGSKIKILLKVIQD